MKNIFRTKNAYNYPNNLFFFISTPRTCCRVLFISDPPPPQKKRGGEGLGGGMFFWIFFMNFWDKILKFYMAILEGLADLLTEFWPAECHFWPLTSFRISFFAKISVIFGIFSFFFFSNVGRGRWKRQNMKKNFLVVALLFSKHHNEFWVQKWC